MAITISAAEARKLGLKFPRSRKGKAANLPKQDQEQYRQIVRAACEAYGIQGPSPFFEYRFCADRKWRFDMAFFSLGGICVALEVQGAIFTQGRHTRGAALLKEHEKLNEAACLGWRVLFCTPKDVESGAIWPVVKRALGIHEV